MNQQHYNNIKIAAFNNELEKIGNEKSPYSGKEKALTFASTYIPSITTALAVKPISSILNKRKGSFAEQLTQSFGDLNSGSKKIKHQSVSKLQNIMKTNVDVFKTPLVRGNAMFNPNKDNPIYQKGVHLPVSYSKNIGGVLSHELGHAKNLEILKKLKLDKLYYGPGRISHTLSPATSLGVIFGNENTAKNSAIAGTAMAVPTVAEEAIATIRGLKGLTKLHGGLGKALIAGGGLKTILGNSSYGIMGATPAIAYGVRKYITNKSENKK